MYKKCEEILNDLENQGKIKKLDFIFPSKQELKLKLKDMLEDEVDEKYYLSEKQVNQTLQTSDNMGVIVNNKTICLNSKSGRNGIEGLQPSLKDRIYDSNGIATCCATSNFFMPNYTDGLRIRKLTPKECWRLMGFDDEDFEKASKVNSNTQLYKQAGNSIVVNILEAILRNLLLEDKQDIPKGQMNIYDYLSI